MKLLEAPGQLESLQHLQYQNIYLHMFNMLLSSRMFAPCRLLSKAEGDLAALERQLAAASEQESAHLTEIHDLEAALADK